MSETKSILVSTVRGNTGTVWLVLTVLTAGSFWLGVEHALGTTRASLSLILVIAFVKAWFVARYFMEMRHAPIALRAVTDGWFLITATVVIGMFLA
ncbi:cytochrome C oxidase subunit IV family protein [Nocardia sp. NPDC055029]